MPRDRGATRRKADAYLAQRLGTPAPETAADDRRTPQVRATVIRLSDVTPQRVEWLWPLWIPFGKLTVLDGHPGVGKSHLTVELAACVTTGRRFPDGTRVDPGDVVLLTAEDGLEDTVRPRIDAAGGDADRIHAITGVRYDDAPDHMPELPKDVAAVRSVVEETGARLVIVDPLSAYLGGDVNSWKDQDVRRALSPLKQLAEDTGAALLILRHLTKAPSGQAITAGGGSIGIIGAARAAILAAKDPEDESRVVLAVTKSNLGPKPTSLRYTLIQGVGTAAHIEWLGTSTHSADTLIAASQHDEDRSALAEAIEWLREYLLDGEKAKADIAKDGRRTGISERTLARAKEKLHVKHERRGFGPGSFMVWMLPPQPSTYAPDSQGSGKYGEYGSKSNANTHSDNVLAHSPNGVASKRRRSAARTDAPTLTPEQELAEIALYGLKHGSPC